MNKILRKIYMFMWSNTKGKTLCNNKKNYMQDNSRTTR